MITIKKSEETRREVNIREWNDEARAFIKSFNMIENLVFHDQLSQFQNKTLSAEERAEAGVNIAIMALVGEDGTPILSIDQLDELKGASFAPIWRIINLILVPDAEDETLKNE